MVGRYEVPMQRQLLECKPDPQPIVACRHSLQLQRSLTQRFMGNRHPAQSSVYPRLLTAANWGFIILAVMSVILVLLGIAVLVGAAMVRWWAPPPSSVSRSLDFDYTRSIVTAEASFISDLRSKTEVGPHHVVSSGWPHLRGHSMHHASRQQVLMGGSFGAQRSSVCRLGCCTFYIRPQMCQPSSHMVVL